MTSSNKFGAKRSRDGVVLVALMSLLSVALGCSGRYDAKVSGTVRIDDELVDRGTVSFYPESGGAPAYGRIGPTGEFQLRTGDAGGLAAGSYRVAVQSVERIPGATENDAPRAKTLIPLKYRDATTSGLTFTVEQGRNVFDIQLSRDS